ncbi:hypothetical protein [Lentibacillus salicampi]|uniref:DUF2178 domain-containing protein n=1 Tax=Lentibacillus salicampi TaxID=175306 RepID=A0A4Y9AB36_9BACI|nr:hypothetical protein [Lentibacillus salicampi]TFJ93129.1 hypothetical protein E4U82_08655 [Lentibacillus salicampi]
MLVNWIVPFLVGIAIFFIIGWFTGSDEYGGIKTKDDERSQFIKQKAIVSSWILLLVFFVINFIFDLFDLNNEHLAMIQFQYPELFYLLFSVGSYFVYYWIYNRRMSSNEK